MFINSIEQIKKEIAAGLPGKKVQDKMAPEGRPKTSVQKDTKKAAVLILLYPQNGEIYTVFIKRPMYDGVHGGQISLPGGKHEKKDISLIQTAIRETEEEIGIPHNLITTIGNLTKLYIPVSNIEVLPVIGYTLKKPIFTINKKEVDYLIESDIKELSKPNSQLIKYIEVSQHKIKAPIYKVAPQEEIWGATAMILSEFFAILNRIPLIN